MSDTTSSTPSFQPPAPSAEHLATQRVAARLAALCGSGQNLQAIEELYADGARHVEAMEMPGCPRVTAGKTPILERAREFARTTEFHGATCSSPSVNGDQFVCEMSLDCTSREGPMAGQRMELKETALYTVKDGRIVEAKFFYAPCGG